MLMAVLGFVLCLLTTMARQIPLEGENSDLPALMDFRAAVEAGILRRRLQNAFRSALLSAASNPNALPFRPYFRNVAPSAADYESSNQNDLMD